MKCINCGKYVSPRSIWGKCNNCDTINELYEKPVIVKTLKYSPPRATI